MTESLSGDDGRTLLSVSKNYRWIKTTREFYDVRTATIRSDSLYEAKVDVYEDRVQTWFLDYAVGLLHPNNFDGDYRVDGD